MISRKNRENREFLHNFTYTANVRFKLRISQNRIWAYKNRSKQFLWIKRLRETTSLCVEVMKSKRQVKRKLGQVVQIHVYASLRSMAVCREHDWAANPQKRAWTESEAARKMKTFQVVLAPISSRFLCPRPPLLFSAPNQNRHPTLATFTPNGKREFVPRYQVFPLVAVYCLRYRSLSLYRALTCLGLYFPSEILN